MTAEEQGGGADPHGQAAGSPALPSNAEIGQRIAAILDAAEASAREAAQRLEADVLGLVDPDVAAAHDAGLPLGLLVAMAQVESGVDQTARSHVGAVGLLQLMPSTAASLHLDPSQVKANLLAGAQYLRLMLSRYGSTELALAAYNAGPTAVDRAAGAPTVETIAYVTNVEQRMTSLTGCV